MSHHAFIHNLQYGHLVCLLDDAVITDSVILIHPRIYGQSENKKMLLRFLIFLLESCFTSRAVLVEISEPKVTPTMFLQGVLNVTDEQDPAVQPRFNYGQPTVVTTHVRVLNINSVSEANMDFAVDIVLTMSWKDRRVRFHRLINLDRIEMHRRMMERLWTPDVYFVNEKISTSDHERHEIARLFLRHNGRIFFSKKCSLRLTCEMDLFWYPHDTQYCSIQISSFGQSTSQLQFQWNQTQALIVASGIQLPQFIIQRSWTGECHESCISGEEFTCLEVHLALVRQSGYYTLQTYIPSIMIVTVSWLSFWLSVDATPARVSLGVLTLLTMTTQTSSARATLPRISYATAIDVWMITCLTFTFLALVEYAVVSVLTRWKSKPKCKADVSKTNEIPDKQLFMYGIVPLKRKLSKELCVGVKKVSRGRELANCVDKMSRIVFPCTFITLNFIYWIVIVFSVDTNTLVIGV